MAKKKAEVAERVYSLPKELHDEAEVLAKLTAKNVAEKEDGTVEVNEASIGSVIDGLTFTRALLRKVDDTAKELAKKAVPEEVAKKLEGIKDDKSSLTTLAKDLESKLALGLDYAISSGILIENTQSENGCKLAIVRKDTLVIDDVDKIPDEFLLPREQCIDKDKLLKHLIDEATKARAAVTLDLPVPKSTAPGAHLGKAISYRTTAPDVIED